MWCAQICNDVKNFLLPQLLVQPYYRVAHKKVEHMLYVHQAIGQLLDLNKARTPIVQFFVRHPVVMNDCIGLPMLRLDASLSDMTDERRTGVMSSSCLALTDESWVSFSPESFCRCVGDEIRLRDLSVQFQQHPTNYTCKQRQLKK